MSWSRTARQKQLAPVGPYKPRAYRVVVHDMFHQLALHRAAQVIRNGMEVPEFLLFCAAYVVDHHRDLKRFRSIFLRGAKDIKAAVAAAPVTTGPLGPGDPTSETVRDRVREEAFDRFARWAESALFEEKPLKVAEVALLAE